MVFFVGDPGCQRGIGWSRRTVSPEIGSPPYPELGKPYTTGYREACLTPEKYEMVRSLTSECTVYDHVTYYFVLWFRLYCYLLSRYEVQLLMRSDRRRVPCCYNRVVSFLDYFLC